MSIDDHRNIQLAAEIIHHDARSTGVCNSVRTGHGTGFIYQQSHRQIHLFLGKTIVVKILAVILSKGTGTETPAHEKIRLLAAVTLILQKICQLGLHTFGKQQKRW